MASIFAEDHETGTDGTTLTTSNTDYSGFNPTGTKPTIATAQFVSGTRSMRINPSGSAQMYAYYTSPSLTSVRYMRAYVRLAQLPSAPLFFMAAQAAAVTRADFRILDDGRVQIRNNFTQVWTSTTTLSVNTWYRVEWRINNTTSLQECNVYLGHNTSPVSGMASGNRSYNMGTFDDFKVGSTTSIAGVDLWVDDVAADNANWVGPSFVADPLSVSVEPSGDLLLPGSVALTCTATGGSGTKTYAWTCPSGPSTSTGQFSVLNADTTVFTPAGGAGTYLPRCTVTDSTGSAFGQATIQAIPTSVMAWTKTVTVSA